MLNCSKCGWVGVNLVPKPETDQAACPQCGVIFQGISAENACLVPPDREKEMLDQFATTMATFEALSPPKITT